MEIKFLYAEKHMPPGMKLRGGQQKVTAKVYVMIGDKEVGALAIPGDVWAELKEQGVTVALEER